MNMLRLRTVLWVMSLVFAVTFGARFAQADGFNHGDFHSTWSDGGNSGNHDDHCFGGSCGGWNKGEGDSKGFDFSGHSGLFGDKGGDKGGDSWDDHGSIWFGGNWDGKGKGQGNCGGGGGNNGGGGNSVPEPSSLMLLVAGMGALAAGLNKARS